MDDWTDRPAGDDRSEGGAEQARVITGRGMPTAPPPSIRTAPLPGMLSPAPPGRTGEGHPSRARRAGISDRGSRSPKPRPSRRRRVVRLVILLVCALVAGCVGTYVWADTKLDQEVNLGTLADRAPRGKGTNYLVVGSDSREGLSQQDRKDLRTGSAEGRRTDSMILLHTGVAGTTMMSLPRDSWVTIPPYVDPDTGRSYRATPNKLNAAFSLGGPELLVRTVERNTGLHVDHYAEIGFAGFVGVVDAVGGVDLCLDRPVRDKASGANLSKGCQTLDGAEALAFVRQRKQEAQGDLGRTQNQQKFLAALAAKAATPGTLLNPAKSVPTATAGLDTLVVDEDTGLPQLMSLFQAMRKVTSGGGRQLNVPVADPNFITPQGSAVRWDAARARQLFGELREDLPVTAGQRQ
ncbi:LCP family protein [Streptomyces sp. NL15-2K]|uniref:LCP family protein n=1 Tax=Streptomyces sp. NL15-2K TaxID=376149 RepID=UPI000F5724E4|nr:MULTISPECIES: LCP family protein [Actinomycetes]WKX15120.1 LCP family protein [Kutzneria buriramensis]GCB52204.1 cell envelope-associated transcriptional attenuator LytR-CpsA-Psr [Streptomyces sp. NL15-2K]